MTSTLKRTPALLLATALLAMALVGALAATQAQAARHFDGTVVSKNSDSRTFRIKTESGNRVRFRVNGNTEFQRIPGGFSGLHKGLPVEVNARRTDGGGRLAKLVEKHRRGGGGGGGGRHGGADDGPNHT